MGDADMCMSFNSAGSGLGPSVASMQGATTTTAMPAVNVQDATSGVGALGQDTAWDPEPATADAGGSMLDQLLALQAQAVQLVSPGTSAGGCGAAPPAGPVDGAGPIGIHVPKAAADPQLEAQVDALRTKLEPIAHTIDANERQALQLVVDDARARGEFVAEELATVMLYVEGSAYGVPEEYLDVAVDAQAQLAGTAAQIDALIEDVDRASRETGQLDQSKVTQIAQLQEQREFMHEQLRLNFDFAKRDPAGALEVLQPLLQVA
jgi:hypothetical protein